MNRRLPPPPTAPPQVGVHAIAALLGLALFAPACLDRQDPRRAPASRAEPDAMTGAPRAIGRGQGEVPQFRLPQTPTPPQPYANAAPVGRVASWATLPEGGALFAWAVVERAQPPLSAVVLRRFDREGVGGPPRLLHRGRGTVRGLAIAARANDAMAAVNAEFGGYASTFGSIRFRHDGTTLGRPSVIGSFRVAPTVADASVLADAFGFPAAIIARSDRYFVALRGPQTDCAGVPCSTARVADVDDGDDVRGRGGIEHGSPAAPFVLLPSPTEPNGWSAAITVLDAGVPTVRTLGRGGLAQIGTLASRGLECAWYGASGLRVLVRLPRSPGARVGPAYELLAPAATGPAVASALRPAPPRLVCAGGVPAARFEMVGGVELARITDVGGDAAILWVLAHEMRPGIAMPVAVGWTGAALLIAREGRVEAARCVGEGLGVPAVVP